MSKKELSYPQADKIFEKTPLDEFIEKRINKLPKSMSKNVKKKLLNDAKFFGEHGIKTDMPEPPKKALSRIPLDKKKAYPNYDSYQISQPERDTKKWIQKVRELYARIHQGENSSKAMQNVTAGMDRMEQLDFQNWLRFYQEGAQLKYKTAQVNYWEDANRAGYFVPIFPERPKDTAQAQDMPLPTAIIPQVDHEAEAHKRELIEMQRNKIIGRLDSAEKLLRSQEGQLFADKELEALLGHIYTLKTKIHMVNKLSTSTRLYDDMIVRSANILTKQGFIKAAGYLHTVAQAIPNPIEAKNPLDNSGVPGSIPGQGPGMAPEGNTPNDTFPPTDPNAAASPTATPPGIAAGKNEIQPGDGGVNSAPLASAPQEEPVSEGMKEFLEGLDTGNDTFEDMSEGDDEGIEIYEVDDLISSAQAMTGNLETTDPAQSNSLDNRVDKALSGLTLKDVVNELEEVAKIFKVREIARRLSLVDMGLNQLGMASLFPSMAEAINKSLESNQYISTRVDDILSRLRGTLETKDIDLTEQDTNQDPQAMQAKKQIAQENDQEVARKKMRKDQENQESAQEMNPQKITPEIDVGEEMGGNNAPASKIAPPLPTAPAVAPGR